MILLQSCAFLTHCCDGMRVDSYEARRVRIHSMHQGESRRGFDDHSAGGHTTDSPTRRREIEARIRDEAVAKSGGHMRNVGASNICTVPNVVSTR